MTNRSLLAAMLAAALALATPALAQKSKDTLRVGYHDPISTVDVLIDPKPETSFSGAAVFDNLIVYDPATRQFRPGLAESWTRIDTRTLELKLRRGVKFHDGSDFTADDVVYSIRYMTDPASKLRFADNYNWMERAEKVDSHTVRILAKKPTAYDLVRLATNTPMYPAALHGKLADKSEFGRKAPVGTGPYKVESVDPTKGVVLVRNTAYVSPGPWRPAGTIGRIHMMPIPDLQTQVAQLMTGGIDLIHEVSKDQADQLATAPNVKVTANQGIVFFYMGLDAANRAGNAALANADVRKALHMAIDRKSLGRNVVAGGEEVVPIDALCIKTQVGCAFTSAPPPFDPKAAKELLAKAGYPDGFEAEITSFPGAHTVAEAVTGELRKIGVRASLAKLTFAAYRQKQRDGKIQILVGHWSSGGLPDVSSTMNYYFGGGPRDYWRDETINKLAHAGESEMDPEKRMALYQQVFDRINAMHYIMPLTTHPSIFVHTAEVRVDKGSLIPAGAEVNRIHWN